MIYFAGQRGGYLLSFGLQKVIGKMFEGNFTEMCAGKIYIHVDAGTSNNVNC
jgi:hypothetical protein